LPASNSRITLLTLSCFFLDLGASWVCFDACALLIAMSATFLPFLGLRLGLAGRPFNLVRPVGRRHLSLFYVLGMTRLKRLALTNRLIGLDALLAKADHLFLAAFTCLYDVRLFRMIWRPLWLIAGHRFFIDSTALAVILSHYFLCLAVFLATFLGC